MNIMAFNQPEEVTLESQDLKALNDFLQKPNSIGLDNLKEIFRNMIQLMMELKGYSTGYALQLLPNGEHSSLALAGVLKGDEAKRKRMEELERLMRQLEAELLLQFEALFKHVEGRLEAIELNVDQKIAILDEQIADDIEADEGELVVETKKKKRKMLKAFKARIKERKQDLKEVENSEDIIEVEADLARDIEALENRTIGQPTPPPANPFSPFAKVIKARRTEVVVNEPSVEPEQDEEEAEPQAYSIGGVRVVKRPKTKRKSGSGSTGSTGRQDDTSGSGDQSEGKGSGDEAQDEDIAPPQNLDL